MNCTIHSQTSPRIFVRLHCNTFAYWLIVIAIPGSVWNWKRNKRGLGIYTV